ncbi:nucleoside 2-deoxyribosyltransferase [Candidatus Harpocratesius sp.]
MKKLYFAGPHGFSEIGVTGTQQIKDLLKKYFDVIDPFNYPKNIKLGKQINTIMKNLHVMDRSGAILNFHKSIDELSKINIQIARNNKELLQSSDLIFAILDGPDVDSGTATEIGMAYILGKKIYGFRSDFRLSGDNYGCTVNLQVEYCIKESGGRLFHSLADLESYLNIN